MALSPLGIFSAAGAGGVAPVSDFVLLSTATISGSSSSVLFSSLGSFSSTYRHLQIRYAIRGTRSATTDALVLQVNTNLANYSDHRLVGNGAAVSSTGGTSQPHVYLDEMPAANFTANAFSAGVIDILDAYSTTKNKTIRVLCGRTGTNNSIFLGSGMFLGNTGSITDLALANANGGNITSSSRVSIYGIKG